MSGDATISRGDDKALVPLPRKIVFGMVGDVLVGPDRRLAIEMADAEAEPVEGLSGASVLCSGPKPDARPDRAAARLPGRGDLGRPGLC